MTKMLKIEVVVMQLQLEGTGKPTHGKLVASQQGSCMGIRDHH
jgi:hypothetical protein